MNLRDLHRVSGNINVRNRSKARRSRVMGIKTRANWKRFSFIVRSRETYSDSLGHVASVMYPYLDIEDMIRARVYPMREDVSVFCTCPAFLYWGSRYWATTDDYLISGQDPEYRFPWIRDPEHNHPICKHLYRVVSYISHESFPRLIKRFSPKKRSNLKEASINKHIKPILERVLKNRNFSSNEISDILSNVDDNNVESILEKYCLIPDSTGENLNKFFEMEEQKMLSFEVEKDMFK